MIGLHRRRTAALAAAAGTALAVLGGLAAPAHASPYLVAQWDFESPASYPMSRPGELVYFPATQSVIMVDNDTATPGVATWSWDGQTWTNLNPPTMPPNRADASIAYHPGTGKIVLFGGYGDTGMLNDTWTFDGTTWQKETPLISPSARGGAALAHDPKTSGMLLFGGWCATVVCYPDDLIGETWLWNGLTWVELTPAQSPSPRTDAVMSTSTLHGNVVLFGGTTWNADFGDTWTWNGATWVQVPAAGPPPQTIGDAAMTDALTEVLFVGMGGETWTWNGVGWTKLSATTSYLDIRPGFAFDAANLEAVLYTGYQTQTLSVANGLL